MTTWLTNNEILEQLGAKFPLEEIAVFCKINAAFHQILAEETDVEESDEEDDEEEYEFEYWLKQMENIESMIKLKNG